MARTVTFQFPATAIQTWLADTDTILVSASVIATSAGSLYAISRSAYNIPPISTAHDYNICCLGTTGNIQTATNSPVMNIPLAEGDGLIIALGGTGGQIIAYFEDIPAG